ncbi:MAG: outer membrane lipoprotein chaperone LolA [Candidatus Rokubacteria bacterium]|nr:outer membrane lipoprotein chaperone LolA [Candidatus Rokubacteria bacterium]
MDTRAASVPPLPIALAAQRVVYSGGVMRRVISAILACWLLVVAPPAILTPTAGAQTAPPAQQSLDDVIRGLEGAYGKINDLKADFSQNAFNKSLNQAIPATGSVFLKKGGKLRWEYTQPTPQQIVSDGKTLWVYTPSLNQVNVAPAPEALAGPAGSFLVGLGKLREHFGVRFMNPAQPRDRDGNVVLDLAPKQSLPTLSRLILSIDPKSWEVRKAVIYDQFENTVTMQFTRMALNAGLADTLFTFTPPKGVATVPLK